MVRALPLGIIITSDETEDTLQQAFEMYCNVLPENAFYGRGVVEGPEVVMTDNCSELRQVIRERWNKATLLLCIFHILQQIWRWIYEKKHGISANHCVQIMRLFK